MSVQLTARAVPFSCIFCIVIFRGLGEIYRYPWLPLTSALGQRGHGKFITSNNERYIRKV